MAWQKAGGEERSSERGARCGGVESGERRAERGGAKRGARESEEWKLTRFGTKHFQHVRDKSIVLGWAQTKIGPTLPRWGLPREKTGKRCLCAYHNTQKRTGSAVSACQGDSGRSRALAAGCRSGRAWPLRPLGQPGVQALRVGVLPASLRAGFAVQSLDPNLDAVVGLEEEQQ